MAMVRRVLRFVLIAAIALALFAGGWLVGRLGIGSVVDPASLTETERRFADDMRNVVLVGSFTVAGREDRAPIPIDTRSRASKRSARISGVSTPK